MNRLILGDQERFFQGDILVFSDVVGLTCLGKGDLYDLGFSQKQLQDYPGDLEIQITTPCSIRIRKSTDSEGLS